MKFTKEQKLAMAIEHVDEHVPLYQLYEKYGIGGQHAKYFIALYRKHGAKAFEDKAYFDALKRWWKKKNKIIAYYEELCLMKENGSEIDRKMASLEENVMA